VTVAAAPTGQRYRAGILSGMGTLVLLRHGQSVWNAENLFTGWVDVPLSALGEEEATRGVEREVGGGDGAP